MHTLADLTRISGLKRRTVQLWAEGGVLVAEADTERQGSGVHRLFSRNEAVICVTLAQLDAVTPPIGKLKFMASLIRKELQKKSSLFRSDIEALIAGEKSGLVIGFHATGRVSAWWDCGDHQMIIPMPGKADKTLILIHMDEALRALRFV